MPPKNGRKRKADVTDDCSLKPSSAARAIKGVSGKGTKVLKPLAEYAADDGQENAKNSLKAAGSTQKRGLTAINAKTEIQKHADKLLELLNEGGRVRSNITEATPLQELRNEHKEILKATSDGRHSCHLNIPEMSSQIINDCVATASAYKSMSKRNTGIKQPDWMRWPQDIKDLKSLNRHVFELAKNIVEQNLLGAVNGKAAPMLMSRRLGDLEKMAWEMLEDVMPRDGEATWGTVANTQLRALVALSKAAGKCAKSELVMSGSDMKW
ncbi:hypothetical protein LIA77_03234 [Sarocladium implicatum]|nr:hypothetical protein LIA77_03234 [Sarocladium implicatum]